MNNALNKYESYKKVFSIAGYSHMRKADRISKLNDTYFLSLTNSWSWATWKDRWDLFDSDLTGWEKMVSDKKLRKSFNYENTDDYFSMVKNQINGEIYKAAYLKKIQRLIEREVQPPLAVILDQYFTAPYLASGNPRQIAQAMWETLDEIRKPAVLMNAWLENPTESRLENLLGLASKGNLSDQTADETESLPRR